MLYTKEIEIPANIDKQNPYTIDFEIRENAVKKIKVNINTFYTKGLVGVKVFVGKPTFEVFSFPKEAEEWITETSEWEGELKFPTSFIPISIVCYNLDSANQIISVEVSTANIYDLPTIEQFLIQIARKNKETNQILLDILHRLERIEAMLFYLIKKKNE